MKRGASTAQAIRARDRAIRRRLSRIRRGASAARSARCTSRSPADDDPAFAPKRSAPQTRDLAARADALQRAFATCTSVDTATHRRRRPQRDRSRAAPRRSLLRRAASRCSGSPAGAGAEDAHPRRFPSRPGAGRAGRRVSSSTSKASRRARSTSAAPKPVRCATSPACCARFDYAAAALSTTRRCGGDTPAIASARVARTFARARRRDAAFLGAYRRRSRRRRDADRRPQGCDALLDLFLIEKAAYEIALRSGEPSDLAARSVARSLRTAGDAARVRGTDARMMIASGASGARSTTRLDGARSTARARAIRSPCSGRMRRQRDASCAHVCPARIAVDGDRRR